MEHADLYLWLAVAFGLFMAWGIGANDVANAMATSIGAKVLTIRKAILVAAVFEFAGAVLAGGEVTNTIRGGIVDADVLADSPDLLITGMLAALLAAGTWLLIASAMGWPVSTTHSIVGAIVGFAAIGIGMHVVHWDQVGTIAASWVVSPLVSGIVAFLIFTSVQRLVLETPDPFRNAKRYVPIYIFATGFFITLMTLFKGLKHVGLQLKDWQSIALAIGMGGLAVLVALPFLRRISIAETASRAERFAGVERVFAVLMVFTACSMAFAHGSNDVANAIGPVAAILGVLQTGMVTAKAVVPFWLLLLGGAGIVVGLATYGQYVIRTIGQNITHLTPSRGFAAELSAATTVVVASGVGLPISTTHSLVGAVMGVGLARGIAALDLGVVRTIFMSWIITLPAGALLSVLFFVLLRGLLA
jgi:inorganic phosphate transporter, PiT family